MEVSGIGSTPPAPGTRQTVQDQGPPSPPQEAGPAQAPTKPAPSPEPETGRGRNVDTSA